MNNIIAFTLMGEPFEIRADVVSVEKSSKSITIEYEDGSFDRFIGYGAKLAILEIIANVAMTSYHLGKYKKSVEEYEYLSELNEKIKNKNHDIKLQNDEINHLLNNIEEKLGL